jgi:hypothetical protein
MLTDSQKIIVRHLVEEMRPESEVTLGQINSVNGVKVYKIYELYEFVHGVLRESPRRYKFTKENNLAKSIIYRTKEYG